MPGSLTIVRRFPRSSTLFRTNVLGKTLGSLIDWELAQRYATGGSHVRDTLVNAAVVLMLMIAAGTTALTVRRELVAANRRDGFPQGLFEVQEDWLTYSSAGHTLGPPNASVTIVEFADFRCGFCRAFKVDIEALRARYPGDIRLIYRHYPLGTHPLSVAAAQASECAAEQGQFAEMHDALFDEQESIGVSTWSTFAAAAGVRDLDRFISCMERSDPVMAVERDIAAAEQLGIAGTPTVLINGIRVNGNPGLEWLNNEVERLRRASEAARR